MVLLDYFAILLFVAGILLAGLAFSGKQKDIKSFFSAGGSVPWGISGLSLFMGFFSAGTFVVWGSIGYSHGLVAVMIQETMCLAGLLVGLLIAPRWHRTRALTAAEYITERFGLSVQKTYTILFLFVSLFNTGAFLYPIAKIISVSTGLGLNLCIILLGLFCILYVSLGGLWSVVITDVLQFVVLMAAVVILVPLALDKVGGVQGFIAAAPADFFHLTDSSYTWAFMIAFGIYNAVFIGGNWAYVQRYTSVKSDRDARKVGLLFSGLYVICPVLWMLPPMLYRIVNGGLVGMEDEGAFLMMCKEVLPSGMLGMMLGGMIFATASSFNAMLNISAGVFTNDIYRNIFTRSSEKSLMRVAKISTVFFGLLAIVVALLVPGMGGIVNVVISVAALTGVPLFLPVIWTLFSRYQTRRSIMITTLVCLAVNLFFKFASPSLLGITFDRATEMIVGVALPVLMLTGFDMANRLRKSPDPMYEAYQKLQETKQNAARGASGANRYGVKVIGVGTLTAGVIETVLGLFASHHKLFVVCLGLALTLVGTLLLYSNRKKQNA